MLNFYTSFLEENGPQNKRFEKLSKNGFKIIKKKLKFIKNNGAVIKKGNLDIELALDSYKNKDKYTTYILFSGDSDFECLMQELKKENKTLHTYSTKEHVSRELINCSDRYFDMKKLKDIFSR